MEHAQYLPAPVVSLSYPSFGGLLVCGCQSFAPGWSNVLTLHVGIVVFALLWGWHTGLGGRAAWLRSSSSVASCVVPSSVDSESAEAGC